MKRRQWFLLSAVGLAAAMAVSGSVGWMQHADREDSWSTTHERFTQALNTIDARISRIPPGRAVNSMSDAVVPASLTERSAQIAAALDSLDSAAEPERLGALAGLRANLAELEYRVDLAELASAGSNDAVPSLIAAWLREDADRLDEARRLMADSTVMATFDGAVVEARGEYEQLDSRFGGLLERQADPEALRAFAMEVAGMRRDHRALVRSLSAIS